MRFGVAHRTFVDGLALLGVLALVATGVLPAAVTVALVVGGVLVVALPDTVRQSPLVGRLGTLAMLALIGVEGVELARGAAVIPAVVTIAAAVQLVRVATRHGGEHDLQITLLALLHFVTAAVVGSGPAYAICFLALLCVAPTALALSQLRREVDNNYRQGARDRTGLPVDLPRILRSQRVASNRFLLALCALGIPVFLTTALLFAAFPRIGLSWILVRDNRGQRLIGFSDHVDLGGLGPLQNDTTLALRVVPTTLPENPPEQLGVYFRGTAFDTYDGRAWSRSMEAQLPVHRSRAGTFAVEGAPRADSTAAFELDLQPIDPPVLFVPDGTAALGTEQTPGLRLGGSELRLTQGSDGSLRAAQPLGQPLRYSTYFPANGARGAQPSHQELARYLTLPPNLPSRTADLARRWTEDATTPEAAARSVEAHLRREYTYALDSPSGGAPNPLDDFLFESKRGHCEFYSTAMAMLLRTQGIPTRNVAGFVGGVYNRFGRYYAVRQGDAHSWVEAYLPERGWTRFDPTPPAALDAEATGGPVAFFRDLVEAVSRLWQRDVVGYNLERQRGFVEEAEGAYSRLKTAASAADGRALTRGVLAALGVLALALAARALWRRRRARGGTSDREAARRREEAIGLYQRLERTLARGGLVRAASTPPLRFALNLVAEGHPAAPAIRALTERYLEARFGERPLDATERSEFDRALGDLARALTTRTRG